MINNRYFLNSFFADHLILINFSAIFAYILHKSKTVTMISLCHTAKRNPLIFPIMRFLNFTGAII